MDTDTDTLDEEDFPEVDPLEDPTPVGFGQKTTCICWRLICPPKNWREPIPIDISELAQRPQRPISLL